jgi:hypothetical protein
VVVVVPSAARGVDEAITERLRALTQSEPLSVFAR